MRSPSITTREELLHTTRERRHTATKSPRTSAKTHYSQKKKKKKKVAKLPNPNPDAQLYPTLQPHVCSLPDSIVHGIFPGMNTGVGCHFLFQGIFLIQESNPGLLHCRQIIYPLSHEGTSICDISHP